VTFIRSLVARFDGLKVTHMQRSNPVPNSSLIPLSSTADRTEMKVFESFAFQELLSQNLYQRSSRSIWSEDEITS